MSPYINAERNHQAAVFLHVGKGKAFLVKLNPFEGTGAEIRARDGHTLNHDKTEDKKKNKL